MLVTICHQATESGGAADDLDVLEQVRAVSKALTSLGAKVSVLACDLNLAQLASTLERAKPRLVFNLVESLNGQGSLIAVVPALLDTLGIAYTGTPSDGLYLSSNKLLARERLRHRELPIPAGFDGMDQAPVGEGRFIVKSVWEHASFGLDSQSVVVQQDVRAEIASRQQAFGGRFFAEMYLDGREFNVGLLGDGESVQVLPLAEMVFESFPAGGPKLVDYAAKWDTESFGYRHTFRRFLSAEEESLGETLRGLSRQCWSGFGLQGYARVDFRVCGREAFIIDVNANPCLSPDAGFSAALEQGGISFESAIERVVEAALRRQAPVTSHKG